MLADLDTTKLAPADSGRSAPVVGVWRDRGFCGVVGSAGSIPTPSVVA